MQVDGLHKHASTDAEHRSGAVRLIFLLLAPDVLSDLLLALSHRRHEVPSRPEVLPHVIPLFPLVRPRDVDRAPAFDVSHHVQDRQLRRDL